jgi:hypothetical protein
MCSACMYEVMFEHFAKCISKLKNKTKVKLAKHSSEHCEMGWDEMGLGAGYTPAVHNIKCM